MSIDANLLKILKRRGNFERIFYQIPHGILDKATLAILKLYKRYFDTVKDDDVITVDKMLARLRVWYPNTPEEKISIYTAMLRAANGEVSLETEKNILSDLLELALATKVMNTITEYHDGLLKSPLVQLIDEYTTDYKRFLGSSEFRPNQESILEIVQEDAERNGIKWGLASLNDAMRPLRGGDFGIIAARPDSGKTGFIISQAVHWARQLDDTENILWLNNEGTHKSIILRLYQSALGMTKEQVEQAALSGTAIGSYEAVVGRHDKIRVINIHGRNIHDVEAIIRENSPKIIIYDMIDNITGYNSDGKETQRLEKLYQKARELCVEHDCIGIAASQISVEGENLKFPNQSMLKESKTAKQGACDFILMLGRMDLPIYENSRFISLPKNKLRRTGSTGDPRAEVHFVIDKVQFHDVLSTDVTVSAIETGGTTEPGEDVV